VTERVCDNNPMATVDDIRTVLQNHEPWHLDRTPELKIAAVAAVVRSAVAGVELLFIHRAEDPSDPWSGHMAFPGGRVEAGDRDALAAAVRETGEEIGLDLETGATLLGRLSDVAAVGRGRPMSLVIEPYVFAVGARPELEPNHEVAAVVWVPLDFLLDRSNRSTIGWRRGGFEVELPCYRFRKHVIWGLTFGMVDELVTLLEGGGGPGRWLDPRDEL
jgi:8-oxo-dGTP pyrophosphatase MutT (NUDIX family)